MEYLKNLVKSNLNSLYIFFVIPFYLFSFSETVAVSQSSCLKSPQENSFTHHAYRLFFFSSSSSSSSSCCEYLESTGSYQNLASFFYTTKLFHVRKLKTLFPSFSFVLFDFFLGAIYLSQCKTALKGSMNF